MAMLVHHQTPELIYKKKITFTLPNITTLEVVMILSGKWKFEEIITCSKMGFHQHDNDYGIFLANYI